MIAEKEKIISYLKTLGYHYITLEIELPYTERLILNYIIEKINDYIEKINILWYH
ncbi:hypothetical protein NDGK_01881 [Clostridiales bacterium CHKCI001]|nr:hypothetical protein NDGK_01881 [Clostridiales bacterium CHKCI001]